MYSQPEQILNVMLMLLKD